MAEKENTVQKSGTDQTSDEGSLKASAETGAGQAKSGKNRGPNAIEGNAQGAGRQGAGGQGGGKPGPHRKRQGQPPQVIQTRPMAAPAQMKRHHWGGIFGFFLIVLAPVGTLVFYLWFVAVDQYASTAGFTVRQEEGGSATDLMGGLAQFAGAGTTSDSDVLYEFIQSQNMVERVDAVLDLRAMYTPHWDEDPVFSLWPDASIEDLLWYWERVVRISYEQSTGLIELRVQGFEPEAAQEVAQAIVTESQRMINALNATARDDSMRYATGDVEVALERLKRAREALTKFRTRTQIVDPETDIQARLGVLSNLQQQLAEALVEHDLLLETVKVNDPRLVQAQNRIEVIRARIASERQNFANASTEVGSVGEDYPTLIAEYESLSVDLVFAEETYRLALAAMDVARANVQRQSRYLATYINPTLPQDSEYPQRYLIAGLAALFLLLVWGILTLVYFSLRDRQ